MNLSDFFVPGLSNQLLKKAIDISKMQIFVGSSAYTVDAGLSVESLKSMIENQEFIPADQIRLMADGGRVLEFGTLEANGVAEEDELAMALEVEAGMRKSEKAVCRGYDFKSDLANIFSLNWSMEKQVASGVKSVSGASCISLHQYARLAPNEILTLFVLHSYYTQACVVCVESAEKCVNAPNKCRVEASVRGGSSFLAMFG